MNSVSDFLDIFTPFVDLSLSIISVQIFGVPLWTILLNFLLVSFVIGFITHGSVGLGMVSHVSGAVDRSKAAKQRKMNNNNRVVVNHSTIKNRSYK